MLVFVSDLHLSDGTSGRHNIKAEEVEMFLKDIASGPSIPEEVTLVLLGDIFDMNRSTFWLEVPEEERPWGRRSERAKEHARTILERIVEVNKGALQIVRNAGDFLEGLRTKPKIIFVPGNHDRLLALSPSLRKRVREVLGIEGGGEEFPRAYDDRLEGMKYGVFAQHGHEFDVMNFEEDLSQPPIGDLITAELLVRLPKAIMGQLETMPMSLEEKEYLRRNLEEIDNVRPYGAIFDWLFFQVRANPTLQQGIEDSVKDLASSFQRIKYVKEWCKRHGRWGLDEADSIRLACFALKHLNIGTARRLMNIAGRVSSSLPLPPMKTLEASMVEAAKEFLQRNRDYSFCVMGHTHNPCQLPIGVSQGREQVYINTGTWRRRHIKAEDGSFISMKALSYAIFYSEKESRDLRFEAWMGSLKTLS